MKTSKITVSRGTFTVRDRGNKDGIPVIMLHGWPESSYCWEEVTTFLDPALRVIAPDLRGLGDSERTLDAKAYQTVELAKDIVDIIDALRIDSFFLVGHDWGGIVAQEVALLIPQRVKKLVLMNIFIITNKDAMVEAAKVMRAINCVPLWYQHFQQQPGLAEAMIKGNEEVWIPYFFGKAGRDGIIPPKVIAEYIRCYRIKNTPATGASYYRGERDDFKHWATLGGKKFPMPTLYIYGNEDSVVIPEYLNHIEEYFDQIKVETIKAAHFVQDEKAKEVALWMNNFLQVQAANK